MRTRNPRGIRKIDVQRERRASYREAREEADSLRRLYGIVGQRWDHDQALTHVLKIAYPPTSTRAMSTWLSWRA
jgi:hypothetical protein